MSSSAATQPRDFYRDQGADARVSSTLRSYLRFYRGGQAGATASDAQQAHAERHRDYAQMVNQYYDLATDFYERGWGQSFHFAPRFEGEAFAASLARHEHYLALRLGLTAGQTALDVGCGVGGPMRAIARFSGASVDGINNNDYQLEKLGRYNAEARTALAAYVREGRLKTRDEVVDGLEHAPAHLLRLFSGDHRGKLMVKVADPS